jgi:hypothetical protein
MYTILLVYVWLLLVIGTVDNVFVYSKRLIMFVGPFVVNPHLLGEAIVSHYTENVLLSYPKDYCP